MMDFIYNLPRIEKIHREEIYLNQPFEIFASKFADIPGTIVLLSGTDLDCAKYNILALKPWLKLKSKGENLFVKYKNDENLSFKCNPLDAIDNIINHFDISNNQSLYDEIIPINAGLFGYLGYDLKDRIEELPKTCIDQNLPDMVLYAPSVIIIQDIKKKRTFLCITLTSGNKKYSYNLKEELEKTRNFILETINDTSISNSKHPNLSSDYIQDTLNDFSIDSSGFKSNFTKEEYLDSVKKIIEYIKAGDIYQVNFSQRFEAKFSGNCYSLFLKLFKKNPAPFFAFINAEDHFILSTSPERFIKRNGDKIETRPIKGTIARGENNIEDEKNAEKLLNSFKDDAELSMIVDLMRNDLGKIAKGGSVSVKEHKRLESYDNVFHLISIIEAQLKENTTSVDIIKATFPGGSITGCPKVRTMEIIDELEPVTRHIYTGSIGYFSFHNTLDLSIVIRTAIVSNGIIGFSVGGGIVYDSIPEKEFKETLDKGKTFLETLTPISIKSKKNEQKAKAWVNGKIINEDSAFISATCPGFQYGAGFFETIKVKKGIPLYLEDHIKRFNFGWYKLFKTEPPDLNWNNIIDLLISENFLENKTSAVKIIGAEGGGRLINGEKSMFLAVFAKPYTHRLKISGKRGIELITYPYKRDTPLADHKSLNYMYNYLALKYAKEKKADEALILNIDGTVSETNTCNIMSIKSNDIIIPISSHVLPGIALNTALKILSKTTNFNIITKKIKPKDFFDSEQVLLTNSLMGAVPVISLNGKKFNNIKILNTQKICDLINTVF